MPNSEVLCRFKTKFLNIELRNIELLTDPKF